MVFGQYLSSIRDELYFVQLTTPPLFFDSRVPATFSRVGHFALSFTMKWQSLWRRLCSRIMMLPDGIAGTRGLSETCPVWTHGVSKCRGPWQPISVCHRHVSIYKCIHIVIVCIINFQVNISLWKCSDCARFHLSAFIWSNILKDGTFRETHVENIHKNYP